jgi:hypothetical protein
MRTDFSRKKPGFILANLIVFTVACSLFFFDVKMESDRTKKDSSLVCLELSGKVLDADTATGKTYNVELMLGDQCAENRNVRNSEAFTLKLHKGRHYMLCITDSDGYGKVISVYTNLPSDIEESYHFSFTASLGSPLQFIYPLTPTALIAYDHELRDFSYSEEITSHFGRKLYSEKVSRNLNH